MKLTRTERLILANQYQILEKLTDEKYEAEAYRDARTALERGFEMEYDHIAADIYEDGLSAAECREVLDILTMYDELQHSYGKLDDKPEVAEWSLTFMGFDGNNERKWMSYAEFYCRPEHRRFEGLKKGSDGFNSHGPTLDTYRRQLEAWNQSADRYNLMSDDIKRITDAAIHPSRRAALSN